MEEKLVGSKSMKQAFKEIKDVMPSLADESDIRGLVTDYSK